jgi:hypothetical protein
MISAFFKAFNAKNSLVFLYSAKITWKSKKKKNPFVSVLFGTLSQW